MANAIIIYESKYGNTKLVAEHIAEGMRQVRGVEVNLAEVSQVNLTDFGSYDVILIGSPNHMGGPTGGIRKFIDNIGQLNLKNVKAAVFDTYMSKDFGKAIKKMEKQIVEKAAGLRLAASGLSVKVGGMKGPIAEGELPKCNEFGINMATGLRAVEDQSANG